MKKHNLWKFLIQLVSFSLFLFLILEKKMVLYLVVYLIFVVVSIFFGRIYCTYVCPMNSALQIGDAIKRKKGRISSLNQKLVTFIPFLSLVTAIGLMLITKKKFHKELPVLLILLGISFIYGLFFSSSTWHNYICPYSILLKGGGKLSLFSYRVDESGCIGCKKCVKECPVNAIDFDEVTKKAHINTSLCHQCGHCSSVCPTQAISYRKR